MFNKIVTDLFPLTVVPVPTGEYFGDETAVSAPVSGSGFPYKQREITSSYKHSVSAMKVLARWMKTTRDDSRLLEDIPVPELDGILAGFFACVNRQDGTFYQPSSLKALRTGIEFYLKSIKASYSLTSSREFSSSQAAFRKRVEDLIRAGGNKIS